MKEIVDSRCQQRSWESDTGRYREMLLDGTVIYEEIIMDDPMAEPVIAPEPVKISTICPKCRKAIVIDAVPGLVAEPGRVAPTEV